ncbi:amidohydrolase [Puniceicoccaceae bacterium K14]|nr:amidohydrolase [Puniceicoccaceae bacterium K14]
MIIDAHIHLYPDEASTDPRQWAALRKENYWADCVAPVKGPTLQGWASPKKLLRDMDDARVDQVIILGWYWENPDTCYEMNDWLAAIRENHPDRLLVAAAFNANGGEKALDDIQRRFDQGFVGIGEINPPTQGFAYNDRWLNDALELVAKRNKFANFHVTEPAGHSYPGKIDTPFSSLQNMAAGHPKTKFVFAHLGGLLPIYELNRKTKKDLQNVYYDTAAIPLLYDPKVYRTVCDIVGSERILFGTDYPLKTFPKKQKADFYDQIESIKNTNLTSNETANVLGLNIRSIIEQ